MKKTLKKVVNPHGPLGKMTVQFEAPGATLVAVHNALSFTLAHRDLYMAEADDCEHCVRAMEAFRRQIAHVVENAQAYEIKSNKN